MAGAATMSRSFMSGAALLVQLREGCSMPDLIAVSFILLAFALIGAALAGLRRL